MKHEWRGIAKSMPDDSPKSRIASTLQRLAESNPHRVTGPGIQAGHFVPLCQYYNRKLAAELCLRLQANGIETKTNSTRLFIAVSLCIVAERWHRHQRYHNGMRFTLKDILGFTIVCAVNFAIWRLVL